MIYPFMTLDDRTEIVHSELLENGEVRVYLEKPDEKDCFHSAACYLPGYRWENISGFSAGEISKYQEIISSKADLITKYAAEGGIKMIHLFDVGEYWVFFCSYENRPLEPVHVHVCKSAPNGSATKIWLTRAGGCVLCNNNSGIPDPALHGIMDAIEARSREVIDRWTGFFGRAEFYC